MVLLVHLKVADFDAWKAGFDANAGLRKKHGAIQHWVHRSADDPNEIMIAVRYPSVEAARAFTQDPALREAMSKAGVQGQPHFHFLEDVETVTY
jgi:quinol monooxygenase YgiN